MDDFVSWTNAPRDPPYPYKNLHLYRIDFDSLFIPRSECYDFLNLEEKIRLSRIQNEKDRDKFILCHGCLHLVAGRYLQIDPVHVKFIQGENGKLFLASYPGEQLYFNLSHSDKYALFAFGDTKNIGIDIEFVQHVAEINLMSRSIMTDREFLIWTSFPDSLKEKLFYRIWTLKEAYVKALGLGLTKNLVSFDVLNCINYDKFDFSIDLVKLDDRFPGWSFFSFSPAFSYEAAIISDFKPENILMFDLNFP